MYLFLNLVPTLCEGSRIEPCNKVSCDLCKHVHLKCWCSLGMEETGQFVKRISGRYEEKMEDVLI